jgi:CHAT domain-containing protein
LFYRALVIQEKALGPDHPDVASSLQNLANFYDYKRDNARAEPLYRRALVIWEKALGPDHPHIAVTWSDMALSFAAQGRVVEAVNAAQRATEIQDRSAAAQLSTGSEEQKRLYMNTLVGQTHNDISLHIQYAPTNTDAARLAFTALLRSKGRVLETMTDSLAALRQSLAPTDQALADQLASVYSQLATQLSRGPGNIPPEQYRNSIMALEDEREKLEADIGKQSASLRVEKRLVTIEETQAAIPHDAALVEIARYEPIQFPSASEPNPKSEPRYAAYVLRPQGNPTFADLGEAAPLEAAIQTLRRALADPDLTHDPKPAARVLDRLLMLPIRKLLGDTRWVFVSADGPTHLVPFAALVDENDHYLVERYLFSYVNTGRDLLRFAEKPISSREVPLVLANPAFDDSSAPAAPEATHRGVRSIDMVTQRLLPLGGTAAEAKTIHALFPESRVLTGADATEEALKAVHAPRILHLATHGFFLPEQPASEVLLRGTGNEPTAAERAAILQRENPLLRSGIALAGFNQRKSGIDDGVLTALEVAGLDLYGTRLVVLSACETGIGQASSGEGVYGLRRALSMAGAETQVMSLWQVDTGRTRELMQLYYCRLRARAGRSESMRNVQLAMLSNPETSHPNLWASFIVSGDWRALEGATVKPNLTVHPGSRGCACTYAGETSAPNDAWIAIVLGLAGTMRLRRPISRVLSD